MEFNFEKYGSVSPWELLQKRMVWNQIGDLYNKKILDFGSGNGITSDYFAENNEVIAIEPDCGMLKNSFNEFMYKTLNGSIEQLYPLEKGSFDVVLCHNVLEYVSNREEILNEFCRVLKPNGLVSILKHNRAGRVMQMVVLLNNFENANELLDGKCGFSKQFGEINYYEDISLTEWCPKLSIEKVYGIRTFWDLQQNQEIQKNIEWQNNMLKIEERVSEIVEYRNISSFHHVLLKMVM